MHILRQSRRVALGFFSIIGVVPVWAVPEAVPAVDESVLPPADDELTKEINAIEKKYKSQMAGHQKTIEDESGDKAPIIAKGDCWWDMTSTKFDIPKTTFKMRTMSFDIPKTTFKLRQMSFDYPRCDWEMVKIGFVKTKLLKCRKARKEWSTKIPEFKMERTEIKTKIPEFKMDTTEIKFKTLKCKVDELYVGPSKPSDESMSRMDKAGQAMEGLAVAQQSEIKDAVEKDIDRRSEAFAVQLKEAEQQFDAGIKGIDDAMAEIAANGGNPQTVNAEMDGQTVTLPQMRAMLIEQKSVMLAQLTKDWETALTQMRAGLTAA